jgi:hypothetical protein
MNQKVSWPVALVVVAAVLLLLATFFRRDRSGSAARISPGFQQLSPAEKQRALEDATRARIRRGAPPPQPP